MFNRQTSGRLPSGFTLIEILLVTVLLAILVAVVTPRFRSSFDSLHYKNFVQDTAALMRYAHDRAMLGKETLMVRFQNDPAGCRLEKSVLQEGKKEPEFRPVNDRTGVLRALPQGVRLDAEPPGVIFYPDGAATAAIWTFRDKQDRQSVLRVSGASGDVAVEENK